MQVEPEPVEDVAPQQAAPVVAAAVTMAVVIPTGSTTAITAVLPKTVQAEVQVFTEEVQPTEHPPPWQVCPAGLRV